MQCSFCCSELQRLNKRYYCAGCLMYFEVRGGEQVQIYMENRERYTPMQKIELEEVLCGGCTEVEESKLAVLRRTGEVDGKRYSICRECVERVNGKLKAEYDRNYGRYLGYLVRGACREVAILVILITAFCVFDLPFWVLFAAGEARMGGRLWSLASGAIVLLASRVSEQLAVIYCVIKAVQILWRYRVKKCRYVEEVGIGEIEEGVIRDLDRIRIGEEREGGEKKEKGREREREREEKRERKGESKTETGSVGCDDVISGIQRLKIEMAGERKEGLFRFCRYGLS